MVNPCIDWWEWKGFWECDWSNGQTMLIELIIGLSVASIIFVKQQQISNKQEKLQKMRESTSDERVDMILEKIKKIIESTKNNNKIDIQTNEDLIIGIKNLHEAINYENEILHPEKIRYLTDLEITFSNFLNKTKFTAVTVEPITNYLDLKNRINQYQRDVEEGKYYPKKQFYLVKKIRKIIIVFTKLKHKLLNKKYKKLFNKKLISSKNIVIDTENYKISIDFRDSE